MTAFKYPIQHLFVFPSHDQTHAALIFQISTETISTVENTNQNYVEDGVVTTEGNADGNFIKLSSLLSVHKVDGEEEILTQISKVLRLGASSEPAAFIVPT